MARIKTSKSPYTPDQVHAYLERIGFKQEGGNSPPQPTIENLQKIVRGHLTTFPFENLAMHFSPERTIAVDPQGVFDRLVTADKGLGSYCFGHNTLMRGILQALNYKVQMCPSRPNTTSPDDTGTPKLLYTSHLVLLVLTTSSEQEYLIDVGFGGVFGMSGLVSAVPLTPNVPFPGSAPPEEHRLFRADHPESVLINEGEPTGYYLQARCGGPNWRTLFYFNPRDEVFEQDVNALSFSVASWTGSPLAALIVCIKVFEVGDGSGRLGRMSVKGQQLIKRIGISKEVVKGFENDLERIAAIREYCKVDLKDEDAQWIRGRLPELK